MRHPTDPPQPHRAAHFLGKLAAAGLIAPQEAEIALAAAAHEAQGADRAGLQRVTRPRPRRERCGALIPAPSRREGGAPVP